MTTDAPNAAAPRTDDPQRRPLVLTMVCLVGWGTVALGAARIVTRWQAFQELSPLRAAATVLALTVIVAVLVGYWRMRRWGVWLLALTLAARVAASVGTALPLRAVDLVLPVTILALGVVFFKRLR